MPVIECPLRRGLSGQDSGDQFTVVHQAPEASVIGRWTLNNAAPGRVARRGGNPLRDSSVLLAVIAA